MPLGCSMADDMAPHHAAIRFLPHSGSVLTDYCDDVRLVPLSTHCTEMVNESLEAADFVE
jgi:hypothetical protein